MCLVAGSAGGWKCALQVSQGAAGCLQVLLPMGVNAARAAAPWAWHGSKFKTCVCMTGVRVREAADSEML